ncbi:MAG: hypothetical protein RIR39_193 [Pseudomonadota bacterium]|jgi:hypothetical protein
MLKNITERALIARINRKLAHKNQWLKKCRKDDKWYGDLGDYYVVDVLIDTITAKHVILADFAKELGVLAEFEAVAD